MFAKVSCDIFFKIFEPFLSVLRFLSTKFQYKLNNIFLYINQFLLKDYFKKRVTSREGGLRQCHQMSHGAGGIKISQKSVAYHLNFS